MRVFIAGATGALGLPLVKRLIAEGHQVIGLTRTLSGHEKLTKVGAKAVLGDALDRDGLIALMTAAAPTHVVHLLTALPKAGVLKPKDLEATNNLRVHGTSNVIAGAIAAGAKRIIAESFPTVYGVGDFGTRPLAEESSLPPLPDDDMRAMVEALRSLEEQMLAARDRIESVVLRYGLVYGSSIPSTQAMLEGLRARKIPMMRSAVSIGSFVHIDDAVAATVAALQHPQPSAVYNIVDDEPAALTEFVRSAAERVGARRPFSIPRFLMKLVAPMMAELSMSRLPLSNAKARRELGFKPKYPTYREGLMEVA